jgi:hypothetical protein
MVIVFLKIDSNYIGFIRRIIQGIDHWKLDTEKKVEINEKQRDVKRVIPVNGRRRSLEVKLKKQ